MQRIFRLPGWKLPGWKLPALTALVFLLPLMAIVACGGEEPETSIPPTVPPTATPAPPADTPEPPATQPPAPTEAPTETPEPTAPPTAAPDPTATLAPTQEPQPTAEPATPEPTATPQPTPEPTATPEPTPEPTATPEPAEEPEVAVVPCESATGGEVGNCAPELAGTQEWINSPPLSMESLRGKVVLIDFWTYSCINCIRTIPFLQTWHERYADEGLVILGVHTPEFEFEKVYQNVVDATEELGVAWPVVQDNNFTVWRSYSNRFWPAKYLIDINGEIRFRHFGEGRYPETEQAIRELLEERGAATEAFGEPLPSDQKADAAYLAEAGARRTPELFAGWQFTQNRGGIGQVETYLPAATQSYRDGNQEGVVADFVVPESFRANLIYFQGPWSIGPESAVHARETEEYSDGILLVYSARSVNAVFTSESGDPYKVVVTVNQQYLTEENKGEDIVIGEDGESYLMVSDPKAYKLVEHPEFQQNQILQMFSLSDEFELFSFTFGTYEDGF